MDLSLSPTELRGWRSFATTPSVHMESSDFHFKVLATLRTDSFQLGWLLWYP